MTTRPHRPSDLLGRRFQGENTMATKKKAAKKAAKKKKH
jgi:hypothetical protein